MEARKTLVIGPRTRQDILKGKHIRKYEDGGDNFDDYWTDSDGESSTLSKDSERLLVLTEEVSSVQSSTFSNTSDDKKSRIRKRTDLSPLKSKNAFSSLKTSNASSPLKTRIPRSPLSIRNVQFPLQSNNVQSPKKTTNFQSPIKSKNVQSPIKAKSVQSPAKSNVQSPLKTRNVQSPIKCKQVLLDSSFNRDALVTEIQDITDNLEMNDDNHDSETSNQASNEIVQNNLSPNLSSITSAMIENIQNTSSPLSSTYNVNEMPRLVSRVSIKSSKKSISRSTKKDPKIREVQMQFDELDEKIMQMIHVNDDMLDSEEEMSMTNESSTRSIKRNTSSSAVILNDSSRHSTTKKQNTSANEANTTQENYLADASVNKSLSNINETDDMNNDDMLDSEEEISMRKKSSTRSIKRNTRSSAVILKDSSQHSPTKKQDTSASKTNAIPQENDLADASINVSGKSLSNINKTDDINDNVMLDSEEEMSMTKKSSPRSIKRNARSSAVILKDPFQHSTTKEQNTSANETSTIPQENDLADASVNISRKSLSNINKIDDMNNDDMLDSEEEMYMRKKFSTRNIKRNTRSSAVILKDSSQHSTTKKQNTSASKTNTPPQENDLADASVNIFRKSLNNIKEISDVNDMQDDEEEMSMAKKSSTRHIKRNTGSLADILNDSSQHSTTKKQKTSANETNTVPQENYLADASVNVSRKSIDNIKETNDDDLGLHCEEELSMTKKSPTRKIKKNIRSSAVILNDSSLKKQKTSAKDTNTISQENDLAHGSVYVSRKSLNNIKATNDEMLISEEEMSMTKASPIRSIKRNSRSSAIILNDSSQHSTTKKQKTPVNVSRKSRNNIKKTMSKQTKVERNKKQHVDPENNVKGKNQAKAQGNKVSKSNGRKNNLDKENQEFDHTAIRRSCRTRYAPLAHWRNEHLQWRFENGQITTVQLDKGTKEDIAFMDSLKNTIQKQKKKILRPKKAKILDIKENKQKTVHLLKKFPLVAWDSPVRAKTEKNPQFAFLIKRMMETKRNSFGYIYIDVNKTKPAQYMPEEDLQLTVIEGNLKIQIQEDTFVLENKDMFIVPRGSVYSITNIGKKRALLSYAVGKFKFLESF